MDFRFNGRHGKGWMRNVYRPQKRREAILRNEATVHERTKAHRLGKCDCVLDSGAVVNADYTVVAA